jgi:hypothetical protein
MTTGFCHRSRQSSVFSAVRYTSTRWTLQCVTHGREWS